MGGHAFVGVIGLSDGVTVFSTRYPFDIQSLALDEDGGHLFVAGSEVLCVEVGSGRKVWGHGRDRYDGVVCVPAGVLAQTQNVLVRLDRLTGEVKASREFPRRFWELHLIERLTMPEGGVPMVVEVREGPLKALVLDATSLETTATMELPRLALSGEPALSRDARQVFVYDSDVNSGLVVGREGTTVRLKQRFYILESSAAFSADGRRLYVPGEILTFVTVGCELLTFDTATGELLTGSDQMPKDFGIWSSAFSVRHGFVVVGGRFDEDGNQRAGIFWRQLPR